MSKKMTLTKPKIPEWQDIAPRFDLEAVAQAVLDYREGEPRLSEDDFENCKSMIWMAAETWLPRDLTDLTITSVEREVHKTVTGVPSGFKMFADVEAITNGTMPPFTNFAGQRVVIDWKTRDGAVDTAWRDRQVDSWQNRLYSHFLNATLFIYRGVSRRSDYERWDRVREIIIQTAATNSQEVEEYLRASHVMRDALITIKAEVWPRTMPSACGAYGRECPFIDDCQQYTMPRQAIGDREMSYSRWSQFFLCPEKSRRLLLDGADGDDDNTHFGTAFHRGIGELYRQAMEITI